MKILHVGVGNLGDGGVATYVDSVAQAQIDAGLEVFVSEIWSPEKTLPRVERSFQAIDEIGEFARRWRADVVHLHSQLHNYSGIPSAAVLTAHEHTSHCPSGARYLHRTRTVCDRNPSLLNCLWGTYVDRCGSRNPARFRERSLLTRKSRDFHGHWVAPASFTRDWLLRIGFESRRVHLVHNPNPFTPPIEYPSAPQERTVLFLGRLVQNKGCDVLIRAMAHLPGAKLVILGDGPELGSLQALAADCAVSDRCEFRGWAPTAEVQETCRTSTVLAVPSLWPEPFGLVALEAASAHLPVVASAVGGIPDIIDHGRTGLLVPPGDVEALHRALTSLLDQPALARTMGTRAARRCARRFGLPLHLRRLEAVYRQAMAERP